MRAPDGREWTVGIRWLPRRPKWFGWGFGWKRRPGRNPSDWADGADALGEGGIIVLLVLVAVVFAWFFVFPVLVVVLDLLLLALIAAVAIAARGMFQRPWIVEATSDGVFRRPLIGGGASERQITYEWSVVGWQASLERVDHVAARLQRGLPLDDLPEAR